MTLYTFNKLWTLEINNKAITGTLEQLVNKYPTIEQLVSKGRIVIGKGYVEVTNEILL